MTATKRSVLAALSTLALFGCRIEKVKSGDSSTVGAEPGPGIAACGISPQSRVSEDGLGLLRIGVALDAIRAGCTVVSESPASDDQPAIARIDLGRDTATVETIDNIIRRITLHHQAYRTADSLGVGTHINTITRLRDAVGVTERNKLYAISPVSCGLRFMMESPAPRPPAAQSGRAALRRLSGETRTRELEIVGCAKRK